jgi:phosphate:Na+ symporter
MIDNINKMKLPSAATWFSQPNHVLYSQLAWLHTIASLLIALITITASGAISRFLANGGKQDGSAAALQSCVSYLDKRIINTPLLAIEQARKEIVHMMSVTDYMYADIREILFDFDARRADTIRQHEQVLDCLNHEITAFLAVLARTSNTPDISYDIPGLLQTVSDLEHIGDSCEEILDNIVARKEAGIIFSDDAINDLKKFSAVVNVSLTLVTDCVINGHQASEMELRNSKSTVRSVFDEMKQAHFDRISTGICPSRSAMMFMELSTAFMRIAELGWNIMAAQGRKPQ